MIKIADKVNKIGPTIDFTWELENNFLNILLIYKHQIRI